MAAAPENIDGRIARGLRARNAIAAAMLDLIDEGALRPSAAQIAARAGVSVRTVFQHFADLETVLATAADRQMGRLRKLLRRLSSEGPLNLRLDAFVAQRAKLLETISPVRRAALLVEPFSAAISARLTIARERARREVENVFAQELGALVSADRRELVAALTAASSFPAWQALRFHLKLTSTQARRAMARTLSSLLEQSRRSDGNSSHAR